MPKLVLWEDGRDGEHSISAILSIEQPCFSWQNSLPAFHWVLMWSFGSDRGVTCSFSISQRRSLHLRWNVATLFYSNLFPRNCSHPYYFSDSTLVLTYIRLVWKEIYYLLQIKSLRFSLRYKCFSEARILKISNGEGYSTSVGGVHVIIIPAVKSHHDLGDFIIRKGSLNTRINAFNLRKHLDTNCGSSKYREVILSRIVYY